MKFFNKLLSLIITLICIFTLSSCQKFQNEFFNDDLVKEQGKITTSPYRAKYNDDGSFTLELGITNSTDYSKILKTVEVIYIKDYKDRIIAENIFFDVYEKFYLVAGKTEYIECIFDEEEILLKTSLETLTTKVRLHLEGVVKEGKEPEKSEKPEFTYGITDAEFTLSGGLEGIIAIRNNFNKPVSPKEISFNIVTDDKVKVTKKPIIRTNENEILPGEVLSLSFSAFPDDIETSVAQQKNFDMLYLTDVVIK